MSDYTPTTQAVRNSYIEGENHDCYYEGDVTITPDGIATGKDFDRWLKKERAEAFEQGMERFEQAWRDDHLYPYDMLPDNYNPYRKDSEL